MCWYPRLIKCPPVVTTYSNSGRQIENVTSQPQRLIYILKDKKGSSLPLSYISQSQIWHTYQHHFDSRILYEVDYYKRCIPTALTTFSILIVVAGQGWDRHLYALRHFAEAEALNLPIFSDQAHNDIGTITLSTSTLSSPAVSIGGFVPVVPHGLRVGMLLIEDSLLSCTNVYDIII